MPDLNFSVPSDEINQIIVETISEHVQRSVALGNSGIEQATREALDGLNGAIKQQIREAFFRLTTKKPELLEGILEAGLAAAGSKLAGKFAAVMTSNGKDLAVGELCTLEKLRRLLGYVENGTSHSVRICQDDATGSFVVDAGFGKMVTGTTMEAAIDAAYDRMPKDEGGYPT